MNPEAYAMEDEAVDTQSTIMVQIKLTPQWAQMLACLQAVTGDGIGTLVQDALQQSGPWWYRVVRGAIEDGLPEDFDLTPVLAVLGRDNRRELERFRKKLQRN
jgi:hypothetical protein